MQQVVRILTDVNADHGDAEMCSYRQSFFRDGSLRFRGSVRRCGEIWGPQIMVKEFVRSCVCRIEHPLEMPEEPRARPYARLCVIMAVLRTNRK